MQQPEGSCGRFSGNYAGRAAATIAYYGHAYGPLSRATNFNHIDRAGVAGLRGPGLETRQCAARRAFYAHSSVYDHELLQLPYS
jgi:hypothetical protein